MASAQDRSPAPADLHFELDGSEPDARDHWEHAIGQAFASMAVRIAENDDGEPFRAKVRLNRIHDLAFVDAVTGPCAGVRGRSRLRREPSEHLAVLMLRHGLERVEQGGMQATLRRGDVLICDTQQALSFDMPGAARKQMLLAPRSAVEALTGASWPTEAVFLSAAEPATALLTGHLETLLDSAAVMSPPAAHALRNATLYLVAAAADPAGSRLAADTVPDRLVASMKRWIDDHILDPQLCPAAVAAAHAISLRTAQRLFQGDDESLSTHIRRRRLMRARQALLSAAPIGEIAHRYGFYDAGHFTRVFKAEYGINPGAYRRNWHRPQTPALPSSEHP